MKTLFNFIPRLAFATSGRNPVRFFILLIKLYYFTLTRKVAPRQFSKDYQVSFRCNNRDVHFWLRVPMDIIVLVEIFVFREYEWDLGFEPKTIIDLGAHIGDTAVYYGALYPNTKIIAVEPSPENYARLEKHAAQNKNIIPVNAAVGATDGVLNLHIGKSSLGHSIIRRSEDDEVVSVPQYSLKTLCAGHNFETIDLLKFDIEGAEFPLLESLNGNIAIQAYIGELHFDLSEKYTFDNSQNLFADLPNVEMKKIGGKDRYILKSK